MNLLQCDTVAKIIKKTALIIVIIFCLVGCVSHHPQTMHSAIQRYYDYASDRLTPYFKQAGVHYPPREITLVVFKDTKEMLLYARDEGPWTYIRTFPVLAASGGPGPKLHRNDRQVPEGIYRIIGMNPNSHYDLSLKLDYPNTWDRAQAAEEGRDQLGGNIFIHGSHYSAGCLAIGNDAIQQLFELVYWVGEENVTVIIAPNDLRHRPPHYGKMHPAWLPELYAEIKSALGECCHQK